MRKKKQSILAGAAGVVASAGLLFGAAAPASAAVETPEGGLWDYGVNYWVLNTWSDYYHETDAHGSTACSANACDESGTVPGGQWSEASISATWGGNTAYYNH